MIFFFIFVVTITLVIRNSGPGTRNIMSSFSLPLHYILYHTYLLITFFSSINGTHWEKLRFTQFSTRMGAWLLLTFFTCLHNQLSSTHSNTRINDV